MLLNNCYSCLFDRKLTCFSAGQRTRKYGFCLATWSSWKTTIARPGGFHDPLQIKDLWDTMKRKLTLYPEPATTVDGLRRHVQDAIRHLYYQLNARIHAWYDTRGVCCVFMRLFGHSLLWSVFHLVRISIIYSYNINYLSHQFSSKWLCLYGRCIFFPPLHDEYNGNVENSSNFTITKNNLIYLINRE